MALGNKRTPRKFIKGRTDNLLNSSRESAASASMANDVMSQDSAYIDGNFAPVLYHLDLMQEDIDELRRHISDDRTQTDNNFTTTLKNKLDGIAAGAEVNPSVGDGGLTQNNFTNTLKNKLDGIEASADVTDYTNVGQAIAGNAPDIGTPASSDRVLILDNGTSNRLSYADFSEFGGGGGGSSGPVHIATLGGRLQVGTGQDASAQNTILAGSLGGMYFSWSSTVFAGAYGVSSGLGTPGTSTFSRGTGYNIVNGLFRVLAGGTATIAGTIEFDSSAEVRGQTLRIHVFKIGSGELSALDNGTYDSQWGGTLVASTSVTIPNSSQNITPMRFKSTNGVSVSADDMFFATAIYDGTVTRTRYFFINYQLYTT